MNSFLNWLTGGKSQTQAPNFPAIRQGDVIITNPAESFKVGKFYYFYGSSIASQVPAGLFMNLGHQNCNGNLFLVVSKTRDKEKSLSFTRYHLSDLLSGRQWYSAENVQVTFEGLIALNRSGTLNPGEGSLLIEQSGDNASAGLVFHIRGDRNPCVIYLNNQAQAQIIPFSADSSCNEYILARGQFQYRNGQGYFQFKFGYNWGQHSIYVPLSTLGYKVP